ncbi:MAG: hypothetical protein ACI8RC_003255 [Ilumatobacter sp.]|jgi:hypothetical protein
MSESSEQPDAPVFQVLDIGAMLDVDGNQWPTAVIDAEGHPAITDLARVHAVEGIGDIRTEAVAMPLAAEHMSAEATHLFLLAVVITKPVHCTFGVSFVLPAQGQVLVEAAAAGNLVIATTPPDEINEQNQPLWLAIDVEADLLEQAIANLP